MKLRVKLEYPKASQTPRSNGKRYTPVQPLNEMTTPLRVLFLCAEADPLVKIGGLGDIGGSLPAAIRLLGTDPQNRSANIPARVDIRVALPLYGTINQNRYKLEPVATVQVTHTNGPIEAQAYSLTINRVPFYLIGGAPIHPLAPVYSPDVGYDAHKFIFFSLAALELTQQLGWQPHIVHANDWHTASAVYWLHLNRQKGSFFQATATVQSIHNLIFLGRGAEFPMGSFNLPPATTDMLPDWARQLPLPLGLLTADQITTVSPSFASDILKPETGYGLDRLLQQREGQLTGILNGIDYRHWNPDDDPAIPVTYTPESLFVREANKAALLNELGFIATDTGLEERNTPLLAMVSRMDYQKGVDLAIEALYQLSREERGPWRAIILGTGLNDLEMEARRLQWYLPDRVRVINRFDDPLSHRIYGGADILMMPSRSEACGVAQMIAQHYGCVPVARSTGGLKDTIVDYTEGESTGFLFCDATSEALMQALRSAMGVFKNRDEWQGIQKRGMAKDFSWGRSAQEYYDIYRSLAAARSS